MLVIATDMDRTLLPNGKQKYDGSMHIFRKVVRMKGMRLIFVTGRRLSLLKKAAYEYRTPLPSYAICDVGTTVYSVRGGKYFLDGGYRKIVRSMTPQWDTEKFKKALTGGGLQSLSLQEREVQGEFKLSYYISDLRRSRRIVRKVAGIVRKICPGAITVYSIDETTGTGLLDILPEKATKLGALEYLRKKMDLKKEQIIYCGDSGNDILPLTFGYRAILVRNAIPEVRKSVKKTAERRGVGNRIWIARGIGKLNGYYVSGIIEGLIRFGVLDEKLSKC